MFSAGCLFVTAMFQSGCATSIVHHDANNLRDMAIVYYQDQIMDNLARAKNGQLFLHVNISALNAQIISKAAASVNGGQSLANTGSSQVTSKAGTIPQIVGTIGTVATRPFTFMVNPERDDQVNVNTAPQYGDPFVYDMYLRYLGLQTPGPLCINSKLNDKNGTDTIPDVTDSDNVVSVRQRQPGEKLVEGGSLDAGVLHYVPGTLHHLGKNDYYIPIAFKQPYFDLCVALLGRVVTAEGVVGNNAVGEPGHVRSRTIYVLPPSSELPVNKALQDIKNQLQMLPQF
jgi:hypothetical protein